MLPEQYADLNDRYATPLMREALKLYGVTEFAGTANNPIILEWATELGHTIKDYYRSDATAWCGLFIGICAKRSGYTPPNGFDTLRAKSWAKWGEQVVGEPIFCNVLVFERTGGGHVGIYVGEDQKCYHVYGGNQGDRVSITRIPKERLIAIRHEPMLGYPKSLTRIYRAPSGAVSVNEA